jgi:hypothetical protein
MVAGKKWHTATCETNSRRLRRRLAFQLLSKRTTKEPAQTSANWLAKNAVHVAEFKRMID